MTYKIPLSAFVDQTARNDAAAAQTAAAAAQSTANTALQVAGARNHIFVQATAPTTDTAALTLDDVWIEPIDPNDSTKGSRLHTWDGSAWQPAQLGTAAFAAASITTDLLAAGAVAAGNLAADAINGRTITGGTFLTATDSTDAGVVIKEGSDSAGTYGVVSFPTGRTSIQGEGGATIIGRATLSGSTETGGSLAIKGGTYIGKLAPELDLNVEPNGAGGYRARAWITAPLQAIDGAAVALPFSSAWTDLGGFLPARVSKDASGIVHCTGTIKPVSANQGTGSTIAILPAAFRPPASVSGPMQYGSASCRVDMQANGVLTLQGGSIPASGGFLMLNLSWPGPDLT